MPLDTSNIPDNFMRGNVTGTIPAGRIVKYSNGRGGDQFLINLSPMEPNKNIAIPVFQLPAPMKVTLTGCSNDEDGNLGTFEAIA